ncbi:MAG: glycosyltransferase [Methyloprofundus sp.]|nr:glycosyltransferase [Methyloprofundus sp.]
MNFDLSIIIPVHNGGDKFQQCLNSIIQYAPKSCELIVVADGDTGNDATLAETAGATVIRVPQALGAGKARNLGVEAAQSDLILFFDADVTIHSDTIQKICAVFAKDTGLSALIGSYDDEPSEGNFLSQYRNLFHHYNHQIANENASTFWGACGAIRRADFLAVGGFSDNVLEDVELGYHLREAGYRIRLDPTIHVKHLKYWHVSLMLKTDIFIRAIPWTRMILRFQHLPNDLNLRIESRISVVLVFLLLMLLMAGQWELSSVLAVALFVLNLDVYQFFWKLKGARFTLQVIPWHWLYYLYSGLAYIIGHAQHFIELKQR